MTTKELLAKLVRTNLETLDLAQLQFIAQRIGQSGRGTRDELLPRIKRAVNNLNEAYRNSK